MNIQIKRRDLFEGLQIISRYITNRLNISSIFQGVLFTAEEEKLTLYATNLNEYCCASIKCKVKEKGECLIDLRKITEFISLLEGEDIKIFSDLKQLTIQKEKTKAAFAFLDKNDFPQKPIIKGNKIKITPKAFSEIKNVLFSSSKDLAHPHLTGVNISVRGKKTSLATTDGFRLTLAYSSEKIGDLNIIISAQLLGHLSKISGENVTMEHSPEESLISFTTKDFTVCSRLLEGEFPDFEKVIPTTTKTEVVIKKEEFLRNIKLASVLMKGDSNIMLFLISKKGILIVPKDAIGIGSEIFQETQFFSGEEIQIAFNHRFVVEFLSNAEGEEVKIKTTTKTTPCIFEVVGKKDYLHIIMPLRIEG